MSFHMERRQITVDVQVLACDSPDCFVTTVVSRVGGQTVPDGWLVVMYTNSHHMDGELDAPITGYARPGEWHFHSPRCLATWLLANDIPDYFEEKASEA